jgi:hypothetical protein
MGVVQQFFHDGLHPRGQRGKTVAEIMTERLAVFRIGQERGESRDDTIVIRRQGVREPVQRLAEPPPSLIARDSA